MEFSSRTVKGVSAAAVLVGICSVYKSDYFEADPMAYAVQLPYSAEEGFRPAVLHLIEKPGKLSANTSALLKTCSGKMIAEPKQENVQPLFKTTGVICGGEKAVERAIAIAADPDGKEFNIACTGRGKGANYKPGCYRYCMHLVAAAYGWDDSGYDEARLMADDMERRGLLHKNRNPPLGAVLFWELGQYGHAALYTGNILTNDLLDKKMKRKGGVYFADPDQLERKWGAKYRGWSEPHFRKVPG